VVKPSWEEAFREEDKKSSLKKRPLGEKTVKPSWEEALMSSSRGIIK